MDLRLVLREEEGAGQGAAVAIGRGVSSEEVEEEAFSEH